MQEIGQSYVRRNFKGYLLVFETMNHMKTSQTGSVYSLYSGA
jgi:hypothetical protein